MRLYIIIFGLLNLFKKKMLMVFSFYNFTDIAINNCVSGLISTNFESDNFSTPSSADENREIRECVPLDAGDVQYSCCS